jgi:hypothetical protein
MSAGDIIEAVATVVPRDDVVGVLEHAVLVGETEQVIEGQLGHTAGHSAGGRKPRWP